MRKPSKTAGHTHLASLRLVVCVLAVCLLFSALPLFAQEDSTATETTRADSIERGIPGIPNPAYTSQTSPRAASEVSESQTDARPNTATLLLDSANMQDTVVILREQFRTRVCFEKIGYDQNKDVVTLADALSLYEETEQKRVLTERERQRLELARKLRDMGKPMNLKFDVAAKRVTSTLSAPTLDGLLDKLTTGNFFPSYAWKKANGTYVVFPREGSVLGFPVTLTIENKALSEVIEQILEQQPPHTSLSREAIGSAHLHAKIDGTLVKRLLLRDIPARRALSRAVEAASPEFAWEVAGYKGSRALSVTVIPRNSGDGQ